MRNIFILLLITSIFSLTACSENEVKLSQYESSISGYFDNIPGTPLTLVAQTPGGMIPIDTTIIEEDGFFLFTPKLGDIAVYRVMIDYTKYLTVAAQKGDHIILEADGNDVFDNYYVSGSEESELIKIVVDKSMILSRKLDSIQIDINHFKSAKNSTGLKQSFDMQKELYADYHDFQIDFINNYPNSIAAYFVVVALVPEQDSKQYIMVGTELPKKYPNFEFLSELQEQVGFLVKAAEGTEAQDLVYPSPNGELIALSSLRGKYVLLDFWASWCRPCRAENPNLVKLYNKFKGDKFEIYGFSLDEDANKWTDAIDADGIKWVQTSELLGWKSKGVEMYGIQSIPTNYLLDTNGVIIAKNLVGEELEDKLDDIFGK